jgi:hypothetical protein
MRVTDSVDGSKLTRRSLFQKASLLAGGASLAAAGLGAGLARSAPVKVKQSTVSYQTAPKGRARCDNCIKWIPPQSCKTVEGVISPNGWCSVYAPKA